jgi:hypothetical protein
MRVTALLVLTILAASCSAGSAAPTARDPAWVPCDQLFAVRHSSAAIMAMTDREAAETLANAEVIRARCGK